MYTAQSVYGATPQAPSLVVADQPLVATSTDGMATGMRGLVVPDNPLFWFGAFLLATFGFAGVAGSARLGAARVSGQLGKA
jgi:hypothetical protein